MIVCCRVIYYINLQIESQQCIWKYQKIYTSYVIGHFTDKVLKIMTALIIIKHYQWILILSYHLKFVTVSLKILKFTLSMFVSCIYHFFQSWGSFVNLRIPLPYIFCFKDQCFNDCMVIDIFKLNISSLCCVDSNSKFSLHILQFNSHVFYSWWGGWRNLPSPLPYTQQNVGEDLSHTLSKNYN